MALHKNFINGEWVEGKGIRENINPSDLTDIVGEYAQADRAQTEAAIAPGVFRDVYIAMGEPLGGMDGAWSVRVYLKSFIRWVWAGAILMMFGGLIAATDPRFRKTTVAATTVKPTADDVLADATGVPA